jgi:casein kinase 1
MDLRIGTKWVLKRRLGGGSFGEIYSGEQILTKEPVAVKLESNNCHPPQLINESRAYRLLSGAVGIPFMRWYGVEGDYSVLVMDLLGKSLEELFEQCDRKFSLKTVLMIADQLLARIEYLHEKNILHRDIKPENFMIGSGRSSNLIYVIDLGLSKKFKDPKTGQHIPFREGKLLLGTARYTSINTHLGIEQSRRDDLEGIAYVLIYFLKGTLPWIGLKAENRKQKYEMITEKKVVTGVEVLSRDST